MQDQTQATEKTTTIIGPGRELITNLEGLTLAMEKFSHPTKHYRLIWMRRRSKVEKGQDPMEAWLCEEDPHRFRTVHGPEGVIEAGKMLAAEFGLNFQELGSTDASGKPITLASGGPMNRRTRRARATIFRRELKRLKRAVQQAKVQQALEIHVTDNATPALERLEEGLKQFAPAAE